MFLRSKGVPFEAAMPQWGTPMLVFDVRQEEAGGGVVKIGSWKMEGGVGRWSIFLGTVRNLIRGPVN